MIFLSKVATLAMREINETRCISMRSENGTFAVQFASPTGRGTNWLKNGTSRQKWDGWQP